MTIKFYDIIKMPWG